MTKFVLLFIAFTNVMLICLVTMLTSNVNERIIYNIDKIRSTYTEDAQLMFTKGCQKGMDYPPEYKMPTNVFNENSPTIWCRAQGTAMEEFLLNQAIKLGK